MADQADSDSEVRAELQAVRAELQAQRQLVSELQVRVERYRSVVDRVEDGIISVDERGTIASVNPAAERIFGYPAAELVGRSYTLLLADPAGRDHGGFLEAYRRTGATRPAREGVGRRRDGTSFPVDLVIDELHLGERRLFIGIARDLTELRRLEGQLLQAQRMESIGQFAGGIAHDFNNQLGIILFDLDLLIAGVEEPSGLRDDLAKIRRVVVRAAELTRKLLQFGRRQPLEPVRLNLNQHIREMQRMLARLLDPKISVELRLAEDLWPIRADPTAIDQILINLAANARDAMPDGGSLTLETANLRADAPECRGHGQGRESRVVRLAVRDTGAGMSEEVRRRLFEPFFTTKEPGRGTGLGLTVVDGLVQAHHGWIAVDSEPGRGSCFAIHLPAQVRPDAEAATPGSGERILVVDGEADLRGRAERALAQHGYRVWACASAADARALFAAEEGNIDLLLTDLVLPDGGGLDLAVQLLGERPGLASLLMTRYFGEGVDWPEVHATGAPVLCKPVPVEELLSQVRVALRQGAARSPNPQPA